jgi:S1-C subfamily serine protease
LLLSSYRLFLLLQNIQLFPLPVKPFLPVLFLAFPASFRAATLLPVVSERSLEMLLRQIRQNKGSSASRLAAFLVCIFCCLEAGAASEDLADDASRSAAVCPVVYQLDQSPSSRGYHYSFFGNAFFINEQGYLLTVAHVVETFRDGGQPYILVSRPNSPPRLLQAAIIAVDAEHDVAILRATPNPFEGKHKVTFLPLAPDPAFRGQSVIALSLHPPKLQNAHTFQAPQEDRSSGEVLSYETTQLEKSAPSADVFLLSHPVTRGQSGSPVLALDSRAVVGLVEGRWLRSSGISIAKSSPLSPATPGAAVPIRYAIDLLQRQSIAWHTPQSPPSALPGR